MRTISTRRWTGESRVKPDSVVGALDAALGFAASRLLNTMQEVRAAAGLDFRYSNRPDSTAGRVQTDLLVLQAALNIPMAGGTSIAVGWSVPLLGKVSPALTVNFSWGLSLSSVLFPRPG
jgi:hypothetical protein